MPLPPPSPLTIIPTAVPPQAGTRGDTPRARRARNKALRRRIAAEEQASKLQECAPVTASPSSTSMGVGVGGETPGRLRKRYRALVEVSRPASDGGWEGKTPGCIRRPYCALVEDNLPIL